MKLFTKYSRINVLATVIIFLIASTAFYFTLHFVLVNQIDEDLKIEESEINSYVKEHNKLPEAVSAKDQLISFKPAQPNIKRHFATALVKEPGDTEKERFRQLIFGIETGGQWYEATVSESLEQTEGLGRTILIIAFSTILIILLVSFLINRVVLKRIWKPFYQSLDAVKEFKIGSDQKLQLSPSNIDEFRLMDQTLEKITSQAQLDYLSLKTFSENASHEIQTPLAVIRSKLDLMMQDENLTEKQSEALQAANNSVQKLTRLNQSLLLLAKIENNQYKEVKVVDLQKKIEEKIADFQELWMAQQITIDCDLHSVMIPMNEQLCDILLNNILSNAANHNYSGGNIFIGLTTERLTIRNTSHKLPLDHQKMFQRFYNSSGGNSHNGLGLSIIKEICDASNFTIQYTVTNQIHNFSILFNRVK